MRDQHADSGKQVNGKRGRRRSKTIARKQMLRERKKMQFDHEMMQLAEQQRPRTRKEQ